MIVICQQSQFMRVNDTLEGGGVGVGEYNTNHNHIIREKSGEL